MRSLEAKRQALSELISLLGELEGTVDAVLVEGARDVEALRSLGFRGRFEVCSRVRVTDGDLVEEIALIDGSVAILTDFDEEGRRLNRRLSRLLERRGVKVERRLRRDVGRLMAVLGVYAVEALDDVGERLQEPGL
ncbi:MAG: toprim domain-containing protein [Candidatus Bathyarchaeia archaeon]